MTTTTLRALRTSKAGTAKAVAPSPRRDIQGLRAVAVLAVIMDHVLRWPSGGFVGVDVFFVISGYLITGLLLREHDRTGTISFRGFYVRRFKRILPAAAIVLAATTAASHYLLAGDRAAGTAHDAVWSLFFAGNWRFASLGTDYFQEGLPPSPLQHFWSLGVEEQFYLVWPWLMLAIFAVAMRRMRLTNHQTRLVLAVTIAAVTAVSFLWSMHQTLASPATAYFSTFARAWELGFGALLAIVCASFSGRPSIWRTFAAWLGLAGIVASMFLVPASPGFPAPWAALPVLSTGMVIAAGNRIDQPHLWPLTNRVSGYLGDISYSLYLWHFPVAILLVALLPSDSVGYVAAAMALILVLSSLSYRLVEDPIRRSSWLTGEDAGSRRRRSDDSLKKAGLAVLAAGVAVLCAIALRPEAPLPVAAAERASTAKSAGAVNCFGAAYLDPTHKCGPASLREGTAPAVTDMAKDEQGAFDCWITEKAPVKTCNYTSGARKTISVALVGDSHAAMLIPGIRSQLATTNWSLDTYVGWGCQWTRSGSGGFCSTALPEIQNRLVNGAKYDVVITTAARQKSGSDKDFAARDFAQAWEPVIARGTKVVVVGDNPLPTAQALECLSRVGFDARNNDCGMSREEGLGEADPLVDASKQAGVRLVDLTTYFCSKDQCPAVIGNVITYRDTAGHITATYSKTIGPYLVAKIKSAIAQ